MHPSEDQGVSSAIQLYLSYNNKKHKLSAISKGHYADEAKKQITIKVIYSNGQEAFIDLKQTSTGLTVIKEKIIQKKPRPNFNNQKSEYRKKANKFYQANIHQHQHSPQKTMPKI